MDHAINRKQSKFRNGMGSYLMLVLFLLLLLTIGGLSTERAFADSHQQVALTPGETYDVTDGDQSRTLNIDKDGDYTLSGKSQYVNVIITAENVNLYLEDGLNLDCTNCADSSQVSPIWVKSKGGTVRLISMQGAQITLSGKMAPGIRKDDGKANLMFETTEPERPGTINVFGGEGGCAAIGSIAYGSWAGRTTGNITFNSGNVIAKSAGNGAGIGGGQYCDGEQITINGGKVKAQGALKGAGIGGGAWQYGRDICINGGEVIAESQSGAAIGGGAGLGTAQEAKGNVENIIINDGTVKATSHGNSAAIGGAEGQGVKNLQINDGKVCAQNDGDMGSAIGAGCAEKTSYDITINGGHVEATSSKDGPAMGVYAAGAKPSKNNQGTVTINGGTVIAKAESYPYQIGGGKNTNVVINGGSLFAKTAQIQGTVKNDAGTELRRVVVSFQDVTEDDVPITELLMLKDHSYGMNDVVTVNNGKLYAWLPKDESNALKGAVLTMGGEKPLPKAFQGDISFDSPQGTMTEALEVVLVTDNFVGNEGSAWAVQGVKKLIIVKEPGIPEDKDLYKIAGYIDRSSNVSVAEADGTLIPNAQGFTDAEGRWIDEESEIMTLYAKLEAPKCTIQYDSNLPEGASTKSRAVITDDQGQNLMKDQLFEYYTSQALTPNAYYLPGYTFDSWNTEPDGTGTKYENEQELLNLTEKDGAVITLYAQWKGKEYTVVLQSSHPEGPDPHGLHKYMQQVPFDKSEKLKPLVDLGWNFEGYILHGWTADDSQGSRYRDYDDFRNLCILDEYDEPQGLTLTAEWVPEEILTVAVTKDSEPQQGLQNALFLKNKNGSQVGGVTFTYDADSRTYTYTPSASFKSGDYYLCFDTTRMSNPPQENYKPATVEIHYDGQAFSASPIFDYYSLSLAANIPEGASVRIMEATGQMSPISNPVLVPDDQELVIQTNPKEAYHFESYAADGVEPAWNPDPKQATQTIRVQGKAALIAKVALNEYTVHFDPNAETGISGEMDDQTMVCNQTQALSANRFKREYASFKGWKDDEGKTYTDQQEVRNLTMTHGGSVTLHAQWEMTPYKIAYDLADGEVPAGKENPATYTVVDTITLNNPIKNDFDFIGWTGTDLSNPAMEVTIPEGSNGDRAYKANWFRKQFDVSFEANGGTQVDPQTVNIHGKAIKPQDPTRNGYDFNGWFENKELTKVFNFGQGITTDTVVYAKWTAKKDPVLMAWGTPSGKKAVKTKWTTVPGAAKYLVYAGPFGKKLKLVKESKGNSFKVKKIKKKKLRAHKSYVFCVVALDRNGKVIATSKQFHVITAKTMGKYANIKKIKAKKTAITLKKGQSEVAGAKYTLPKKKKHISKKHGPYLRFTTDNPRVASVDAQGNVIAKDPGTAIIYIQDTCGKYCTVNVTVQ